MSRVAWSASVALLAAALSLVVAPPGGATAQNAGTPQADAHRMGHDVFIMGPVDRTRGNERDAAGPDTLFLNRCVGGCPLRTGSRAADSSANNVSSIARMDATVSAFRWPDTTWDAMVACVRDVYLPYGVEIVTTPPAEGTPHVEMIVAGIREEIGLPGPPGGTLLGIAPATGDCTLGGNWIAYTFANAHTNDPIFLCATVAHEAGHVYGLEHVFECSDPMTYLEGCGQKFFRSMTMACGADNLGPCQCGSGITHQRLIANIGKGADVPPPVTSITLPVAGPVTSGFSVFASVTDRRGVATIEMRINGWPWASRPGIFNSTSPYIFEIPGEVPPGVMDIEIRGCGDTGPCSTAQVTVTEGAPCANAEACLDGQVCEAGKCFWNPPSVELGSACTYDQECLSLTCADTGDGETCTETCFGPPNDFCPDGFECSAATGAEGFCRLPADEGGCCSTGGRSSRGALLLNLGLGAMIALLIARRRRK